MQALDGVGVHNLISATVVAHSYRSHNMFYKYFLRSAIFSFISGASLISLNEISLYLIVKFVFFTFTVALEFNKILGGNRLDKKTNLLVSAYLGLLSLSNIALTQIENLLNGSENMVIPIVFLGLGLFSFAFLVMPNLAKETK